MNRTSTDSRRGFFGIGVYHAKREVNVGTLFRSAHAFGAHFIFTVGRRYQRQASDTPHVSKHMPLYHFETIESLRNNMPLDCRIVGVELSPLASSLGTFCHPERCVYLLGAEDHGLPESAIGECSLVVEIPHCVRCLNVAVAGSIVLYDRMTKSVSKQGRELALS